MGKTQDDPLAHGPSGIITHNIFERSKKINGRQKTLFADNELPFLKVSP